MKREAYNSGRTGILASASGVDQRINWEELRVFAESPVCARLFVLTSLHLQVALGGISSPHFTDEETEAWGGEATHQLSPLTKVTSAHTPGD